MQTPPIRRGRSGHRSRPQQQQGREYTVHTRIYASIRGNPVVNGSMVIAGDNDISRWRCHTDADRVKRPATTAKQIPGPDAARTRPTRRQNGAVMEAKRGWRSTGW